MVSVPCWELFAAQKPDYQRQVIGEADGRAWPSRPASRMGWERFIGDARRLRRHDGFGASAPAEDLYKHFGITAEAVADAVRAKILL